jgi:hypothetical protein
MDIILFNRKLDITPENLLTLVRSFAVTFPHQNEDGRTTRGYYRAETVPNSGSIHINNSQGEWVGDVIVIPLNVLTSRVVVTFNDWENNQDLRDRAWATWSDYTFDAQKKPFFIDLAKYILAIADDPKAADEWFAGEKEKLEKPAEVRSEEEERPEEYVSPEPPRNRIIVKLAYEGYSNQEIGEQFGIEGHSVANILDALRKASPRLHISMEKLNRRQLMRKRLKQKDRKLRKQ